MEQLTNFVSKSFEYNNNRIKEDEGSSLDGERPEDIDIITDVSTESEVPVPLVKRPPRQAGGGAPPAKNWLLPDSERRPPSRADVPTHQRRFFYLTDNDEDGDKARISFRDRSVNRVAHDDGNECVINYSKDRPQTGDENESDSDDESKNVNVEDDEEWSGGAGNGTGGSESRDDEPMISRDDPKVEDGDLKPGKFCVCVFFFTYNNFM